MDRYVAQQRHLARALRYDAEDLGLQPHTPIGSKHADNPARGLTSVFFLAPDAAQQVTEQVVAPLRALAPDHYYLPPSDLHVTVKNVRVAHDPPHFTEAEVARARDVFADMLAGWPAFEVTLDTLTPFVASVALTGIDRGAYSHLVLALDEALRAAGVPDDKLYLGNGVFFPSLTVVRFCAPPSPALLQALADRMQAFSLTVRVDTVTLLVTNSAVPVGSRRVIGTFPLRR